MRRTQLSGLIAVGSFLLLLTSAVAQEGEWWVEGNVDQWSPRLRRVAAMEHLRQVATLGSPDAQTALEQIMRGIDATLADGFWREDGRLSPWGLEYFETELEIIELLEKGVVEGVFSETQSAAVETALDYLLAADVELARRGIDTSESIMDSIGCGESPETLGTTPTLNCKKVQDKLDGQTAILATAFSAMSEERRLDAARDLRLSWKRSLKAERKFMASAEEAIEMVNRLDTAVEDTGCRAEPTSELVMCTEAERRLAQARKKLRKADANPPKSEIALEYYWGAWKVAWSALWQELPTGVGYLEVPGASADAGR